MKANRMKWLLVFLASTAMAVSAFALTPALKVGDPAPKLQNGSYMQGDAVKEFQPGKAYIVEFWATWCGPCRVSIPHLNEISTKYKDKGLVVIGQDCWENDEKLVAPFIKNMGEKMTYRVALDDKSDSKKGRMAETWMEAAGQNGIPTAFLVDTHGVVAWIGHPMELEEKLDVIDQVLAGKYDITKATADYLKGLAAKEDEDSKAAPLNDKMSAIAKAIRDKKWDVAMETIDAAEKLVPESQRASMEANFDVNRSMVLLGKKDYPAAYALMMKLSDSYKGNAMLQNMLAWQIVSDKTIEKPDLDVAQTLADRAVAASNGKEAGILDTKARVLFMKGKKEEAISMETKALEMASDDEKLSLQNTLDSYKKGELPAAD